MKNLLIILFTIGLSLSFVNCGDYINPDPCADIVCFNGGYCANGQCVCPQGFSGADCSQEVTPTQIKITSIRVTEFPDRDENGDTWDLTDGADIKVKFWKKGSSSLLYESGFYEDANYLIDYDFNPSTPIVIDDPTAKYDIALYDYDDFSADDLMDGVEFTPYFNGEKFPAMKEIYYSGGKVKFILYYSYQW